MFYIHSQGQYREGAIFLRDLISLVGSYQCVIGQHGLADNSSISRALVLATKPSYCVIIPSSIRIPKHGPEI